MYILGVDPGFFGAVSCLDTDGNLVSVEDTPVISYQKGKTTKTEYNIKAICSKINLLSSDCVVFLEKMQSLPPGFRIQATFYLGLCQGIFEAALTSRGIKYELILPKDWQKAFGITGEKGDKKAQSYMIASRLFPGAELSTPRGRKLDGRSDALLIAEYGRRKLSGK